MSLAAICTIPALYRQKGPKCKAFLHFGPFDRTPPGCESRTFKTSEPRSGAEAPVFKPPGPGYPASTRLAVYAGLVQNAASFPLFCAEQGTRQGIIICENLHRVAKNTTIFPHALRLISCTLHNFRLTCLCGLQEFDFTFVLLYQRGKTFRNGISAYDILFSAETAAAAAGAKRAVFAAVRNVRSGYTP